MEYYEIEILKKGKSVPDIRYLKADDYDLIEYFIKKVKETKSKIIRFDLVVDVND